MFWQCVTFPAFTKYSLSSSLAVPYLEAPEVKPHPVMKPATWTLSSRPCPCGALPVFAHAVKGGSAPAWASDCLGRHCSPPGLAGICQGFCLECCRSLLLAVRGGSAFILVRGASGAILRDLGPHLLAQVATAMEARHLRRPVVRATVWSCVSRLSFFLSLSPSLSLSRQSCHGARQQTTFTYSHSQPPLLSCQPGRAADDSVSPSGPSP